MESIGRNCGRNPILELGEYGAFDETALGSPLSGNRNGSYWMLYTGRDPEGIPAVGIGALAGWRELEACQRSGSVRRERAVGFESGLRSSVLVEGDKIRVWFGGGDVARPDENLHGQIGYAN